MDNLKADGCEEVFFEKVTSTTTLEQRHQLRACLSVLRKGDLLCVAKFDRVGRSQVEVINRLNDLQQEGIHVRTLDELIDTKALGKMAPLVVGLLTGLSEVERSLIQERSRKSVERRRKTGGNLGARPRPQTKKSPWSCVCVKKVSPIGPSRIRQVWHSQPSHASSKKKR